jgi:hypothetical protein
MYPNHLPPPTTTTKNQSFLNTLTTVTKKLNQRATVRTRERTLSHLLQIMVTKKNLPTALRRDLIIAPSPAMATML